MARPATLESHALSMPSAAAVLSFETLTIGVGVAAVRVPAAQIYCGTGAILSPVRQESGEQSGDLSAAMARVMATLTPTQAGQLLVFGENPWAISYLELCRLRRRLGFVPGRGGLLSNRTLLENVALPLSVHAGTDHSREQELALQALDRLAIGQLAHRFPHAIDGPARFAACVARAMVLQPELMIIEGVGDFEAESDGSHAWRVIASAVVEQRCGVVVCLARPAPAFERWWGRSGLATLAVEAESADAAPAASGGGA